jgi:hypothetical protein
MNIPVGLQDSSSPAHLKPGLQGPAEAGDQGREKEDNDDLRKKG